MTDEQKKQQNRKRVIEYYYRHRKEILWAAYERRQNRTPEQLEAERARMREYNAQYRKAHKEQINKRQREYRAWLKGRDKK